MSEGIKMKEKIMKIEKKKLFILGGFLVLIIVILFGGAIVYNKFFYKRSYSEIEGIMVDAAKSYFAKNQDALPQNYNDLVVLSDDDLVSKDEMKTIQEYLKDESISCSGSVTVTNINGKYRYTPNLDCGNQHKTITFMNYIEASVPVVENGNGLYQLNEELVYRGDNVNNYIQFSGKIYRIVKFSQNQAVIIYTDDTKLQNMVWDDRYNIEKNANMGINDYSVSKVRDYLNSLYDENTLISDENKLLAVAHSLNLGKRSNKDTDKTGTIEKTATLENQFIGLLPLSDFLNASLDSNCSASTSRSCQNYNYLSKYKYNWWIMTANSANTYQVYRISGYAASTTASNTAYVRPVLYLSKDALYVSGDGTKDNPYIVK